jgi:hypothetical protein
MYIFSASVIIFISDFNDLSPLILLHNNYRSVFQYLKYAMCFSHQTMTAQTTDYSIYVM